MRIQKSIGVFVAGILRQIASRKIRRSAGEILAGRFFVLAEIRRAANQL